MKIIITEDVTYRVSLNKVDDLKAGQEVDLDAVDCRNLVGSGKAKYPKKDDEKPFIPQTQIVKPTETKVVKPAIKKQRGSNKKKVD